MTEVLFYHLQSQSVENTLPPLLEKSLERGWRVVIQASSEQRADAIDTHLWTYRDDAFLPHGTWRDRDAAEHPVLLSLDDANLNQANVRFLLDGADLPDDAESYDRIVLIFNGDDDDSAARARSSWTASKARGLEVTYWQADERGRWTKKA